MQFIFFLLTLLAQVSSTLADEAFTILSVEEPPSSFINSNGEPEGFAVDVVHAIKKKLNNTNSIKIVPEARALLVATENPNTLLFAFSRTPERENNFHWISLLLRKHWIIYSKSESSIEINTLEDAKAVAKIGVVIGDIREQYLYNKGFTNLSATGSHKQNLQMLELDRIQLLFYEPLGMTYLSKELDIPISNFKPVFKANTSDVYLIMPKHKSNSAIANEWKAAAKAIKDEGIFQDIANYWGGKIQQETGLLYGYQDGALDMIKH